MEIKEAAERILLANIFSSLTCEQSTRLAGLSSVCTFGSGEEIGRSARGTLSLVLRGGAEVYSADDSRSTLLRVIREGDVFGVAGLFTGSEAVSRIIAKGKTQILLIPKDAIVSLLTENPAFAEDYISFLEKRIAFLNKRISSFTAGSCERKLALFLSSVSEDESFTLSIPFASLARQLDMGRASFYRALGILEDAGLISKDEKRITVLSRASLKEKYS